MTVPVYPGDIPEFTNVVNADTAGVGGTDIDADLLNRVHAELLAALTEMGANPSGGSATVAARFAALDAAGALYLLLNGSRPMTGDLDLADNALKLGEAAAPTNAVDTGFVYGADDGGDTELFYMDAAGNVVQLTEDGAATGGAGVTDHGALTGLADDDHTQYLLATGARAGSSAGAQSFGATGIAADVIAESTPAAGVTVDGVLLKDGGIGLGGRLGLGAPSELTIATGVITVTKSYHTVDTEGDGASDDLVTINGGSDGDLLILQAADDARTVVVKNTGNIRAAADRTLDHSQDKIFLIYDGANSFWIMVGAFQSLA